MKQAPKPLFLARPQMRTAGIQHFIFGSNEDSGNKKTRIFDNCVWKIKSILYLYNAKKTGLYCHNHWKKNTFRI